MLYLKSLISLIVVAYLLLCGVVTASASTVFNGKKVYLPQDFPVRNDLGTPVLISAQSELIVEGENHDSEPRIVILRFDDDNSHSYHSRINIERVVSPGPFVIRQSLFGLKTAKKRLLNWQKWQRFILFGDGDRKMVTVSLVAINESANFTPASMGYDLGPGESPVLRGMKQITPAFSGLKGKFLSARHVSSGNAPGNVLTSDGISGIKSLDLKVPNGRWDVTLWFAMAGEWENLPRQQNQHIQVQGKTVWQRNLSPLQWIKNDYLAGQYQEAWIDGTPWQLFGDKPQQRVTTSVTVSDGQLHLTFAGQTAHDNYLSGIFISPMSMQGRDTSQLLNALKQRFEQKWPVVNNPVALEASEIKRVRMEQVYFSRDWQPQATAVKQQASTVITANGFGVLDFAVTSTQLVDNVQLKLTLQDFSGQAVQLPVEIRQGMWRYQRPQGSGTGLSLNADELQTVYPGKLLRLSKTLSRRINLLIPVPADFSSDSLDGMLTLSKDNITLASSEFRVNILDIKLPAARQSVGIYHEKAAHLSWFEQLNKTVDINLACDYRYLKKLGLTALSAPLTTPSAIQPGMSNQQIGKTLRPYIDELNLYQRFFEYPTIDYTTIKRFEQQYRGRPMLKQRHLAALSQTLAAYQLASPQFAVADEIESMTDTQLSDFSMTLAQLQNAMPNASFVGQLNKPANQQLVAMLDTLLINQGFGVDKPAIKALQRQGKSVWLYNMNRLRLAAGFYLWQSKAQGYLQWHGRMPTGAPFDPTDGREADFQLIYPAVQACQQSPDINAGLLAIAQGISDRRWLNWLIKKAQREPRALRLLAQLRRQIPTEWAEVERLSPHQVHLWRSAITGLAQKLTLEKRSHYAQQ